MTTVVAAYGYIAAEEDPRQWQPHGVVQAPDELLHWVNCATPLAKSGVPVGRTSENA
jgi:hypothetical protein